MHCLTATTTITPFPEALKSAMVTILDGTIDEGVSLTFMQITMGMASEIHSIQSMPVQTRQLHFANSRNGTTGRMIATTTAPHNIQMRKNL